MSKQLLVNSLSYRYGKRCIINNLNLECNKGDIIGVFGRNGAGKSTLFKILFGTLKTQNASIAIDGSPLLSNIKQKAIAFSHQDVFLPGNISVRNLIPLYYPDADGQNKIFYSKGIHAIETTRIDKLSLGEQRYLQFLLIIHLPHPFVVLDEPFTMVDPLTIDLMKEKIVEASANKGIILSDHYYQHVWEITNKRLLLKNGCLTAMDKLSEINGRYEM